MGLGEMREESIEIVGERLDDLRVGWLPAELANPGSLGWRGYHPAGAPAYVAQDVGLTPVLQSRLR